MPIRWYLTRLLRALRDLLRTLILLAALALIGLLVLCGLIVVQGRRDDLLDAPRVDALLVMGAPQQASKPDAVLKARLDHALDLYRRGVAPRIILTGGVTSGGPPSEAAVARDYLAAQGVPTTTVLLEEASTTSWQNLRNAAALARENGIASIIIVSDDFHMLRSLKMASDLGFKAYGSPTRTSPIAKNPQLEAQAVLREAAAYVAYLFFQV